MTGSINKFFRFFVLETPGRTRLIMIVVLTGLIAMEVVVLGQQKKALQKIKSQKALVMRMPDMQAQLEAIRSKNTESGAPLAPRVELNWNLSGTITNTEKPIAFINDKVYEVGAEIEGYQIVLIDREMILVKNLATQEIQSLYFSKQ